MIVYRTLHGPFIQASEQDGVVAVMQTDEGDIEFVFDTFNEFYEMDVNLPMEIDDEEWEWDYEDEEQGEFDFETEF